MEIRYPKKWYITILQYCLFSALATIIAIQYDLLQQYNCLRVILYSLFFHYSTTSVSIWGIHYKLGCFLRLAVADKVYLFPTLVVVMEILVIEDSKFFVVKPVLVEEYSQHYIAYRIVASDLGDNSHMVATLADLRHKFPLHVVKIGRQTFVQIRHCADVELDI